MQQLLAALEVGDPSRIARALALEGGFSLVGAGAGQTRSLKFSRRAEALAEHVGRSYVTALTTLWAGVAAFLTGQWRKATDLSSRAGTALRDECTGVLWELNMADNFFLGALLAQGEFRQVASHLPGLIQSTRERGNFYLELELHTRVAMVRLASDEAEEVERCADECIARWSHRGFQRQHYNYLVIRVQAALYRGEARVAWQLMASQYPLLQRSLLLRLQHTRIETANFRARCALAMAAAGEDPAGMRLIALKEAARIEREHTPWAHPHAAFARAAVAHQRGDVDGAVKGLATAIDGYEAADMRLYAAGCRHRLGALVGGSRGEELHAKANRWMADQDVRNPTAMARFAAPGFD